MRCVYLLQSIANPTKRYVGSTSDLCRLRCRIACYGFTFKPSALASAACPLSNVSNTFAPSVNAVATWRISKAVCRARQLWALLRVAAGGINFLVLDEPTRHMDTSNCQRLKALFNDLFDRQLIVVTVNSEFSDAAGRHFRVTKDDSLHSIVAESW